MSDIAIKVENLGKQYRIGAQQERYKTLRDSLVGTVTAPLRRLRNPQSAIRNKDTIWALKDVSCEVKQGEVVGIIGRNGAGKSTLLKVLAHITEPTEGRVRLRGRVGSLLEVGTGFSQELTGRENIYLNGAILGMKKAEIERKFDEIVAFAEIEKFLDTPVKHYSSGMYVRLAFAVAAHLEPEILLVDEVLAVGDAAFQKKCLGKMGDVAKEGRTVLFVSHNIPAINRLCNRALLFGSGQIRKSGSTLSVTNEYLNAILNFGAEKTWDLEVAPGNDVVRLTHIRIHSLEGITSNSIDIRSAIGVEITFEVLKSGFILVPNLHFFNAQGIYMFVSVDTDSEWAGKPRPTGVYKCTAFVPGNLLAEGNIQVGVAITTFEPWHIHLYERDVVAFQVTDTMQSDSARGSFQGHLPGVIRPKLNWKTEYLRRT